MWEELAHEVWHGAVEGRDGRKDLQGKRLKPSSGGRGGALSGWQPGVWSQVQLTLPLSIMLSFCVL